MSKPKQRLPEPTVMACLPDGLCNDEVYGLILEEDLCMMTGALLAAVRAAFCKGVRYGEQRERRRRRKS